MKEKRGLLCFFILRRIERLLPVDGLYRMLKPGALMRAAVRAVFSKAPLPVKLPGCFNETGLVQPRRLERANHYLNLALQNFPDRLAASKWLERCRVSGWENIESARSNQRPVILAFCHFGPFHLARYWLRAVGIPAATLIGGISGNEPLLKRLKDRCAPFPEVPTTFYQDELRAAAELLAAGNALAMAIDFPAGKQMTVPVRDGWSFQMATGAIRLAVRHQAELVPCCLIDEGAWRFRLELGRPVPREHLASESNLTLAGTHLIGEMIVHFQNHPEQCPKHLLDRFRNSAQPSKVVSTP